MKPDEAAGDAADAAVQADRVLAALLHLERDIHGVGLRIALDVGGFFLLQHFEIAELVEAQDAVVPQLGVEHVAFIEQDFAADDLIARGGVAGEIDAADEELLAFVGGQREIDLVAAVSAGCEVGLGDEIDVAELAVELAHVLDALAQLVGGEDVARGHAEQRLHQHFGRAEQLHAGEVHVAQVVQLAFFHRDA